VEWQNDCKTAVAAGESSNVGPDDATGYEVSTATVQLTFTSPGLYKICYKMYGTDGTKYDYKAVGASTLDVTLPPGVKPKGYREINQVIYYTAPAKLPSCNFWHGAIRQAYETAYATQIGIYKQQFEGEGPWAYMPDYYLHSHCVQSSVPVVTFTATCKPEAPPTSWYRGLITEMICCRKPPHSKRR
jgi:hypothetical protein